MRFKQNGRNGLSLDDVAALIVAVTAIVVVALAAFALDLSTHPHPLDKSAHDVCSPTPAPHKISHMGLLNPTLKADKCTR